MADYESQLEDGLAGLDGFIAAAIADTESGMALGTVGGSNDFDIEVAAAANTEVVKAKGRAMTALQLDDEIEDILISLEGQYHLIRPLSGRPDVFIYLALSRSNSNLALARMRLKELESNVKV
jgi:predicted regulator of Ras-like GTPase activity (Roadblock/LC7/MglB family)